MLLGSEHKFNPFQCGSCRDTRNRTKFFFFSYFPLASFSYLMTDTWACGVYLVAFTSSRSVYVWGGGYYEISALCLLTASPRMSQISLKSIWQAQFICTWEVIAVYGAYVGRSCCEQPGKLPGTCFLRLGDLEIPLLQRSMDLNLGEKSLLHIGCLPGYSVRDSGYSYEL